MSIVLIGYMGCGKSSIGKVLASKLNMKYMDLDDYLEKKEKKMIKQIFKDNGEIYFRKKETEYLKEVLELYPNAVLSLGGGTPCFSGNIEMIKENSVAKSVYLKTSLEELVSRLFKEKENRPLIAHIDTKEGLKDFVRKHLFERSFYYNQAEFIISTDDKEVDKIADEINNKLF